MLGKKKRILYRLYKLIKPKLTGKMIIDTYRSLLMIKGGKSVN